MNCCRCSCISLAKAMAVSFVVVDVGSNNNGNSNSANGKVKRCGEKTNAILLHFDVCTNVCASKFVRPSPATIRTKTLHMFVWHPEMDNI